MNRMLIDSDSAAGPSASTAAPDMQQADAVGAGSANGAPLFGQPAITLTSGCLKDVASRSHYRMRPEGEVEEVGRGRWAWVQSRCALRRCVAPCTHAASVLVKGCGAGWLGRGPCAALYHHTTAHAQVAHLSHVCV